MNKSFFLFALSFAVAAGALAQSIPTEADSEGDFQTPRTFRFSVGIKF